MDSNYVPHLKLATITLNHDPPDKSCVPAPRVPLRGPREVAGLSLTHSDGSNLKSSEIFRQGVWVLRSYLARKRFGTYDLVTYDCPVDTL